MKRVFKLICVPLIQVNNNIYIFVGGILISLATNIFATLCFQDFDWQNQWHQYFAAIMFATASAVCLYLATKMSGVQNYINSKKKHLDERRRIIIDVTKSEYRKWIMAFFLLFLSIVIGIILLSFNFTYPFNKVIE